MCKVNKEAEECKSSGGSGNLFYIYTVLLQPPTQRLFYCRAIVIKNKSKKVTSSKALGDLAWWDVTLSQDIVLEARKFKICSLNRNQVNLFTVIYSPIKV